MPRSFSSGALSISLKSVFFANPLVARTWVIAAVYMTDGANIYMGFSALKLFLCHVQAPQTDFVFLYAKGPNLN